MNSTQVSRAILAAVLPMVLAGPGEALASSESWLSNWADHIGRCKGGGQCECGLTAIRHEARSAITRIDALIGPKGEG